MADETKKKPAPKKEGKPGTKPENAAAKSQDKPDTIPGGEAAPAKAPKKGAAPTAEGATPAAEAPKPAEGAAPVLSLIHI